VLVLVREFRCCGLAEFTNDESTQMKTSCQLLTREIKEYLRNKGADLVGVASVDRFDRGPVMLHPQSLLPEARSVIVVAMHYVNTAVDQWGKAPSDSIMAYQNLNILVASELASISLRLAYFLEKKGHLALPIAQSLFWRYRSYKGLGPFVAEFSHRHAAVAAGLGEFGWSGLVLTPEYGPRQRLVSVITNADLDPDPLCERPSLCDECMKCVELCPVSAFSTTKSVQVTIGEKTFRYARLDKLRCAWLETVGLAREAGTHLLGFDTDIRPPKDITIDNFAAAVEKRDPLLKLYSDSQRPPWCSKCLRVCLSAHQ
jgi:epoxyqueuosine reductase QueG